MTSAVLLVCSFVPAQAVPFTSSTGTLTGVTSGRTYATLPATITSYPTPPPLSQSSSTSILINKTCTVTIPAGTATAFSISQGGFETGAAPRIYGATYSEGSATVNVPPGGTSGASDAVEANGIFGARLGTEGGPDAWVFSEAYGQVDAQGNGVEHGAEAEVKVHGPGSSAADHLLLKIKATRVGPGPDDPNGLPAAKINWEV